MYWVFRWTQRVLAANMRLILIEDKSFLRIRRAFAKLENGTNFHARQSREHGSWVVFSRSLNTIILRQKLYFWQSSRTKKYGRRNSLSRTSIKRQKIPQSGHTAHRVDFELTDSYASPFSGNENHRSRQLMLSRHQFRDRPDQRTAGDQRAGEKGARLHPSLIQLNLMISTILTSLYYWLNCNWTLVNKKNIMKNILKYRNWAFYM